MLSHNAYKRPLHSPVLLEPTSRLFAYHLISVDAYLAVWVRLTLLDASMYPDSQKSQTLSLKTSSEVHHHKCNGHWTL